ncbi:hypothetical protein KW850_26500 [Bacillus sp. sid0103]|nr:hypothetical protein [Bacillus sp. sid0103]
MGEEWGENRVSCHPLRHILLLVFLQETISSMVSQIDKSSYKSFGDVPWICLNKAAKHFQKCSNFMCHY